MTHFSWEGQPIPDIHQWCRDRGEQMVVLRYTQKMPDLFCNQIIIHMWQEEMPETFWKIATIDPAYGIPREVRRYAP